MNLLKSVRFNLTCRSILRFSLSSLGFEFKCLIRRLGNPIDMCSSTNPEGNTLLFHPMGIELKIIKGLSQPITVCMNVSRSIRKGYSTWLRRGGRIIENSSCGVSQWSVNVKRWKMEFLKVTINASSKNWLKKEIRVFTQTQTELKKSR